ncbi:MAG: uracil-DNA glycosylase family protein [Syntrophomonas sp.]
MLNVSKEENIRRIIAMEDRISRCQRCISLAPCKIKPSLGRGELIPDIIMVFESESSFTSDSKAIISLRKLIKEELGFSNIYHTYMVRCQPKACVLRQNLDFYTDSSYNNAKLMDKNQNCLLSGKDCSGIPIKPSDEEILLCLPYLLEEIEILRPDYIFLFGKRVIDYISKSCGFFLEADEADYFNKENITYFCTCNEEDFGKTECNRLKNHFLNSKKSNHNLLPKKNS